MHDADNEYLRLGHAKIDIVIPQDREPQSRANAIAGHAARCRPSHSHRMRTDALHEPMRRLLIGDIRDVGVDADEIAAGTFGKRQRFGTDVLLLPGRISAINASGVA